MRWPARSSLTAFALAVLASSILSGGLPSGLSAQPAHIVPRPAADSPGADPAATVPAPPVCYDITKTFPREAGNYRVTRGAQPVKPFEIMDGLYYVGNTQVSAHLLKTTDGLVLFDTTMPHQVPWLLESLRKLGFKPGDVKVVVGNHAHVDHIGGHWYLQRYFGAQTWMHELEAPNSMRGLWKPGEPVALDGTVTTLGRAFPPFQTDRKLKDGETVEWGGRRLTFRSAPGHTPGTMMIEFPLRGADGKVYRAGMLGGIAPGKPEFTATCRQLRHLEVDIVLGAHPSQNDTLAKAEKLAARPAKNPFVNPEEWRNFLDKMIRRLAHRGSRSRRERPGDDFGARLRFMAWAAKNNLSGEQTRLCWWGDGAPEPGGPGKEAMALLGGFLAGRPLRFSHRQESGANLYVLTDAADAKLSRGLVAFVPDQSGAVDCGKLRVTMPAAAAGKTWSARAVSYSLEQPAQISAVTLPRESDSLVAAVNASISGAWYLCSPPTPPRCPNQPGAERERPGALSRLPAPAFRAPASDRTSVNSDRAKFASRSSLKQLHEELHSDPVGCLQALRSR